MRGEWFCCDVAALDEIRPGLFVLLGEVYVRTASYAATNPPKWDCIRLRDGTPHTISGDTPVRQIVLEAAR